MPNKTLNKNHFYAFLMSCTFAVTPLSADDTSQLTNNFSVDDAISYALSTNPELASSSFNVDLAEEAVDLARAGYRPNINITGGVDYLQSDNDVRDKWQSNTSKTAGIGLEQTLFRGGQTVADINQQQTLKQSAMLGFRGEIQDKIIDIVAVYMETFRANQAMQVNQDNVSLLGEELKATTARFEAGELTKTDVAQAEARLAQANAELANSQAVFEVAMANFRKETGITEYVNLFYPDIDPNRLPEALDIALSMGLRLNPDIIAAMANVEAQDFDVQEQKGAFYPQVSLGAGVNLERDPTFNQYDRQESANIGVNATLPIYQSGVLRNQLRQSKIKKSQSLSDLEFTRRDVTNDIIAAWEEYKAVLVQLQARETQLNASELAYKGVQLEEEVGARSILEVLDANQDVRDAELLLIDARRDKVNAYYRLLGAIGLLDDSLWDKSKRML